MYFLLGCRVFILLLYGCGANSLLPVCPGPGGGPRGVDALVLLPKGRITFSSQECHFSTGFEGNYVVSGALTAATIGARAPSSDRSEVSHSRVAATMCARVSFSRVAI